MKVGTDGVLLGAWTDLSEAKNILDIGTGSGLIALMLAQRKKDSHTIGIEMDSRAATQAQQNVEASIFNNQIEIKNIALNKFQSDFKFNLIVSNPPFFTNSTPSPNKERNIARHTNSLSYKDLFSYSSKLISDEGQLSIIVPTVEVDRIRSIATENNFHLTRKTTVFPNKNKVSKRTLFQFSKVKGNISETSLVLEKERHHYTSDALFLFKDFYLKA